MATLRYRKARDWADQLGQVFTPSSIAELLVRSVPVPANGVSYVVDLGAGQGALARAALDAHRRARALLVELDGGLCAALMSSPLPRAASVQANALGSEWHPAKSPSWVLSNPPYGYTRLTPEIVGAISESGLAVPTNGGWVRGDAAFVARAWGLARSGAAIGLIIASPLVRDPSFEPLRRRMVAQLSGMCVTQLDEATFENAEVRTYTVSGLRSVGRRRSVLLRKADARGEIVDELSVSFSCAVKSLDIDFHRALKRIGISADRVGDTLGSAGASIVRGSRSNKDFERLGLRAFHTTDFDSSREEVCLQGAPQGFQVAKSGDILIPRVGSRCLARQIKVRGGRGLFTESVYRISVAPRERPRLWKTLTSSFGVEWRLANATGSCAKHLTVQMLSTMPLIS